MIRTIFTLATLGSASVFFACQPLSTGLKESQDFSGLYSLGVSGGAALGTPEAIAALNVFCAPENLPGYLDKIAKRLSFNAGYSEHPGAGYDAPIVMQNGPDGAQAYYIGNGQMFDGAGSFAMFPPTNGNISRLVAGYCGVALASLGGGSSGGLPSRATFGAAPSPKCGYPTIEVSQGGNVSGSSAAGSISSGGCVIAKMQNAAIRHTTEIAFCPDALGGNFKTNGDGAASEMSIIIRGGG